MKKLFPVFVLIPIFLFACMSQKEKISSEEGASRYDETLHLLGVDFADHPQKSIEKVIWYSGIRKSGYGILLNVHNAFAEPEIDTLKMKFQKEDINAIHRFDINLSDTLKNRVFVAMQGARFIWVLKNGELNLLYSQIEHSLKKADGEKKLIVTDISQYEEMKSLLQKD
ncbi:MAG: hypothetical protein R2764_03005 [Bacteroidales bacterium]